MLTAREIWVFRILILLMVPLCLSSAPAIGAKASEMSEDTRAGLSIAPNLVANPGFENGASGWTASGSAPGSVTGDGVLAGEKAFGMYARSAYTSALETMVTNCRAGLYDARVWVRYRGVFESAKFQAYVDGTLAKEVALISPQAWWLQYVLSGIPVSDGGELRLRVVVEANPGLEVYLDEFEVRRIEPAPEPYTPPNAISRLARRPDGTYYIEVDGKPFLYNLVQNPEINEVIAAKIAEVNYKAFTLWIKWWEIEPRIGEFNWRVIENAIDLANKYDLRFDIVWAGSNFCGHLDGGNAAPDWLVTDHTFHWKHDGVCEVFDRRHVADYTNPALLLIERNSLASLMNHIAAYDRHHRVIGIQIENEANPTWLYTHYPKAAIVNYLNELARAVKESTYPVITRVNLGFGATADFCFNTPYIDMNGSDPYVPHVGNTILNLDNRINSRFPHLAENGGYTNSTSHMVAAFVRGGGYNIYKLEYDTYWKRPGVYGSNYQYEHHTREIRDFNAALNKIAPLIARSVSANMLGFNYDTGANEPAADFSATGTVAGRTVCFASANGNAPVGMVVADGKYLYCIADNDARFSVLAKPVSCEWGYLDGDGRWVSRGRRAAKKNGDGSYSIRYKATEALRIELP